MKLIGLASDHAGFALKQYVKQWLEAKGWEYKDFGTYTADSCDYADFAHPLALAVEAGSGYCNLWQWRRHQHDSEQTSGHTCRTLLDSRNLPLGTPTQRRKRIGHAGTFHRQ